VQKESLIQRGEYSGADMTMLLAESLGLMAMRQSR
jgi:hypothetical protein